MEFIPIADQTQVSTKAYLTFTLTENYWSDHVGMGFKPNMDLNLKLQHPNESNLNGF